MSERENLKRRAHRAVAIYCSNHTALEVERFRTTDGVAELEEALEALADYQPRQKPIPTAERAPTMEDVVGMYIWSDSVWGWDRSNCEWELVRWDLVAVYPKMYTHWAPLVEPEKPEGSS